METLTSTGTLAFLQALDLNNIDGNFYHMYSTSAGKLLYYYYWMKWRWRLSMFCTRYKSAGILCITICYLSLQESIVEPHLMQDLPIYLRKMNVMKYHSHNMSSTVQLFQLDLLPLCPCIPHKRWFCSSFVWFCFGFHVMIAIRSDEKIKRKIEKNRTHVISLIKHLIISMCLD